MTLSYFRTSLTFKAARLGLAFLGLTALAAPRLAAAPAPGFHAVPGHIPAAVASAQDVSALSSTQPVALALSLPLHHQAELQDLLHGLSDPLDPRFGQFLTPEEFAARYSPTPAEYARVIAYAQAMGLTVTATHANRTVLDVAAPAGQVEKAFGLHLRVYRSREHGRTFYAPDAEPQVPSALASLVTGVVGLSNASRWQPHLHPHPPLTPVLDVAAILDPYSTDPAAPLQIGTGVGGGLAPSDIKAAYNLSSVPQNGGGQTLGLFELDGYTASDITAYESHYGLPNVPLQNVLVDSVSGAPSSTTGPAEVTLDIELMTALAPNASKILVYEGPNSDAGVVDTYARIAADNAAKAVSTSWGEAENSASASVRSSENTAFQQMAAQGQSIYAASGDSGANDNGSSLSVDDPASQPYMVGVGGTSLTTSGAGGVYQSETTWNNSIGAGGGGISTVWPIPSYQNGVVGSAASKGSTTYRNVPDVSLDADPNTGYSVYFNGSWTIYGGTSCAAPLWAAFTSLVNQKRVAAGNSTLGFANPPIYALASSGAYANDFHDVSGGSTNRYYPAVTGYDDATGWGSFIGANLLADLGGPHSAPPVNQVRFIPRPNWASRMVGGLFQGSSDNSSWTTLATETQAPTAGQWNTLPTSADPAAFRYLRYLAPNGAYGNIAELEFDSNGAKLTGTPFGTPGSWNNQGNDFTKAFDGSAATFFDAPDPGNGDFVGLDRGAPVASYTKLTGTPFGTPGSWTNQGNVYTNAFDGNFSTFFDAPDPGNGDFVGLDLGAANTAAVTRIGYAPRAGLESRMVGGVFQGSNDQAAWTTLSTIAASPADGILTEAVISNSVPYRYVRYLAPNGAYGNISELEFDTSP